MKDRCSHLIGIDEVGRGPLAGPLCVGACAVRKGAYRGVRALFLGVKDCKKLSLQAREEWYRRIRSAKADGALRTATAFVGEKEIDARGLSRALETALCRALRRLGFSPPHCRVLLDGGLRAPRAFLFQKTIIRGDEKEPLIALASIVAKVRRDRHMIRLAKHFPAYGFERHKGYGTKQHYEALRKHGACEIHRRSFLKNFVNQ